MEKRYQVFISSTFEDLKEERQAVLKAVLELDHMPAGMELFPAVDDDAWELIKDVIDASDYYVLIVGGRYGSLDETGIGYTEKEYDYAIETKKPVISLLHKNPDNLPRDKTETSSEAWEKLKVFREKVGSKHTCVFWESSEDLKAKVIVGLTSSVKRHPAIGWIRADQMPSSDVLSEILMLRKKIAELESEASKVKIDPPRGAEELTQGDDDFEIQIEFKATEYVPEYKTTNYTGTINPTWNEIFAAVSPSMINELSDNKLRQSLRNFLSTYSEKAFAKDKDLKGSDLSEFKFKDEDIETCFVQLRALGLISENTKQRSVKDTETYWTLTPYGDTVMVQLRAIRKEPLKTHEETAKKASSQK